MLTCLDLAWAAVGPFFLNTVTVSQSLSAIFSELQSIPVVFVNDIKNKVNSTRLKYTLLMRVTEGTERSFPKYLPHASAKALFITR